MSKDKGSIPPDGRLIIEKGGYRPDVGGRTMPPARRSVMAEDGGYRPTQGGKTMPPGKATQASAPAPSQTKK
jgi:hypothetical protein